MIATYKLNKKHIIIYYLFLCIYYRNFQPILLFEMLPKTCAAFSCKKQIIK